VVCLVNTDCKDPTKSICDMRGGQDQNTCVQCVRNMDCPTTTPNCNNNLCGP
jgi:hypothetical protein